MRCGKHGVPNGVVLMKERKEARSSSTSKVTETDSLQGMRVCLFRWEGNKIVEDILPALRDSGCEVLVLEVRLQSTQMPGGSKTVFTVDGRVEYLTYFYQKIEAFDPDLILMCNSHGLDPHGLLYAIAELKEVPVVNWFLDNPYFFPMMRHPRSFHFISYAVFDSAYVEQMCKDGYKSVFSLPLAVNPYRFENINAAVDKPEYGVLFVGRSGLNNIQSIFRDIETGTGKMPDWVRRKVNETIEEGASFLQAYPDKTPQLFLKDYAAQNLQYADFYNHAHIMPFVASIIDFKASFYLRRDIINSIDYVDIAVAGDEPWREHIRAGTRFLGRLPYQTIGTHYSNAVINLNISRYQLKTTMNQRAFDVPAAGGFLITDYRPGVEELFELDKEIVCYCNPDDLQKKIHYYIEHPVERAAIIRRARERTLQEHTYARRLIQLVGNLRKTGIVKGRVERGAITKRNLGNELRPYLLKLTDWFQKNGLTHESAIFGRKLEELGE